MEPYRKEHIMLAKLIGLLPMRIRLRLLNAVQKYAYRVSDNLKKDNEDPDAILACDAWIRKVDELLWSLGYINIFAPRK